ncbi:MULTISPECIES: hypothetical protein [Burkholderia]|uniref:Uncharacterized protein n=1 Tax=Burkholderia humptydooensis TaxID=430531 RepID=A0A7T2U7K3_9BURK|nr:MULTISPECIES: hypothetical protein [Burkholderia]QPS47092.1 hypothetical protein I6G56_21730 [Burkholderia humptydooensis]
MKARIAPHRSFRRFPAHSGAVVKFQRFDIEKKRIEFRFTQSIFFFANRHEEAPSDRRAAASCDARFGVRFIDDAALHPMPHDMLRHSEHS